MCAIAIMGTTLRANCKQGKRLHQVHSKLTRCVMGKKAYRVIYPRYKSGGLINMSVFTYQKNMYQRNL
jgi:hypothetical protein